MLTEACLHQRPGLLSARHGPGEPGPARLRADGQRAPGTGRAGAGLDMLSPGCDADTGPRAGLYLGGAPVCSLTMRRWGVTDRQDDIAVVVSEMLSNAVRHGLQAAHGDQDHPIRLGLLHAGPSVMCAVADPSAQPPVPASRAGWRRAAADCTSSPRSATCGAAAQRPASRARWSGRASPRRPDPPPVRAGPGGLSQPGAGPPVLARTSSPLGLGQRQHGPAAADRRADPVTGIRGRDSLRPLAFR